MKEQLQGYVLYLRYGAESKSDSLRPYLVVSPERVLRLHRPGANPFSETELFPWQGRFCRVAGTWDEAVKVFIVENLEPAEPNPKSSDD
jgi:hypothetical protein